MLCLLLLNILIYSFEFANNRGYIQHRYKTPKNKNNDPYVRRDKERRNSTDLQLQVMSKARVYPIDGYAQREKGFKIAEDSPVQHYRSHQL